MLLPGIYRVLVWRVRHLRSQGRDAEALSAVLRYVRRRATDSEGWVLLGECGLSIGATNTLVRELPTGIALHPSDPRLRFLLIDALASQRRYEEAEAIRADLIALDPDSFFPYLAGVLLASRQGRWADAVSAGGAASARIPDNWPWASWQLGLMLADVPGGEEIARRSLEAATARLPHASSMYPLAHLRLAAMLGSDDPARAAEHERIARRHWMARQSPEELLHTVRRRPPE